MRIVYALAPWHTSVVDEKCVCVYVCVFAMAHTRKTMPWDTSVLKQKLHPFTLWHAHPCRGDEKQQSCMRS